MSINRCSLSTSRGIQDSSAQRAATCTSMTREAVHIIVIVDKRLKAYCKALHPSQLGSRARKSYPEDLNLHVSRRYCSLTQERSGLLANSWVSAHWRRPCPSAHHVLMRGTVILELIKQKIKIFHQSMSKPCRRGLMPCQ
jgi:hypothetical protein